MAYVAKPNKNLECVCTGNNTALCPFVNTRVLIVIQAKVLARKKMA